VTYKYWHKTLDIKDFFRFGDSLRAAREKDIKRQEHSEMQNENRRLKLASNQHNWFLASPMSPVGVHGLPRTLPALAVLRSVGVYCASALMTGLLNHAAPSQRHPPRPGTDEVICDGRNRRGWHSEGKGRCPPGCARRLLPARPVFSGTAVRRRTRRYRTANLRR
jgi:hypothetical protein